MEMYRVNYIGSYICKERAQFGGGAQIYVDKQE